MSQKLRQDISIGDTIRKYRKSRHVTQAEMAKRLSAYGLDISRSIYSQIECGTYNIRVSELVAMARILEVDIGAFFEEVKL